MNTYELFGLSAICLLCLLLLIVLYLWPQEQGRHLTFSHHAASSRNATVFYAFIFALTLPVLSWVTASYLNPKVPARCTCHDHHFACYASTNRLHAISTSWSHNTNSSYPRTFIGRPSVDPASKFRPLWNTTRGSYSAHLDSSSWHVGGSCNWIIPPPLCSLVPNCLLFYVLCSIHCHPCIVGAGGILVL
jgi:hypothetical protein